MEEVDTKRCIVENGFGKEGDRLLDVSAEQEFGSDK